jgi:predicted nucleic acid-binding protein
MVIFDTSLIMDASRRKKAALDLIDSYGEKERIATTIVTKYEMLRGVRKQDEEFLLELLRKFVIFDFKEDAMNEAVKAYQKLSAKGRMINDLDVIIAGIAAANDETLITKDKDFSNLESDKIIVLTQP